MTRTASSPAHIPPAPAAADVDLPAATTLVPFDESIEDDDEQPGFHVYANRQHVGTLVNVPALPTLAKGSMRGEYEGRSSWRAMVPNMEEEDFTPFEPDPDAARHRPPAPAPPLAGA